MKYLMQQNALCNGLIKPARRVFASVWGFQNLNTLHKLAVTPTVLSWEPPRCRLGEMAVPKRSVSSPVTWLPELQRTSAQHLYDRSTQCTLPPHSPRFPHRRLLH